MIKRRKPLARGTKPIKRTQLKRTTKPIKKHGKVGKRKHKKCEAAKDFYFQNYGWTNLGEPGKNTARCQLCETPMRREDCDAHHKKRRGEGGSDALTNFVILHRTCHINLVHGGQMGRPQTPEAARMFAIVENSWGNAWNGMMINAPKPTEF